MVLTTTPATALGAASLIITAYAVRKQGLETINERQQQINARLTGQMVKSEYWGIEHTRIEVTERIGRLYRVLKLLTGRLCGEAEITIKYHGPSIPGDVWEEKGGRAILKGFPYPVEHVVTDETTRPSVAVFRIGSVDPDTIKNFSETLLTVDAENR